MQLEGKGLTAEEAPSPAVTPAGAPCALRETVSVSPSAGAENKAGAAVFSMETCAPRCSFPAEHFPRITSRRRVHRVGVGGLRIQEIETAGFKGSRQKKKSFCPVFPPVLPGLNESAAGRISSVWANRCFQAGCTGAARPSCLQTTNMVLSISRFSEPDQGLGFVPANCDLPEPRVPQQFLEVRDAEDRVFLLLRGLPPAAGGRGGSQGATSPGVIPCPG